MYCPIAHRESGLLAPDCPEIAWSAEECGSSGGNEDSGQLAFVVEGFVCPQPLSTCRLAIATGKFGEVAKLSSFAFGIDAGGVQSLAAGKLIHVPADPD